MPLWVLCARVPPTARANLAQFPQLPTHPALGKCGAVDLSPLPRGRKEVNVLGDTRGAGWAGIQCSPWPGIASQREAQGGHGWTTLQSLDPSVWKSLAQSTTNCHLPSSIENQVWKAPKLALKSLTYLDLLIKTTQFLVHVKAIACGLFLRLLALAGRVL